ncbi:MAG TPA: twin-arginine translocase TatA/TatE family subunit [Solirubrobacteraceae bacterium]
MFNSIGPTELIIVLVIVLLIFGPKRLPGLGKQLGSGMREFKDSISGKDRDEGASKAASGDDGRTEAAAALGRPEGDPAPLEGDVRERAPR